MILVKPETITAAKLTASNVAENDHPVYSDATTYAIGNRVIFNNRIYESLQDANTGNQPDISPTFWLDVGATNRYRMFDSIVNSQTTNTGTITVTITPGVAITAAVFFNLIAATIRVRGFVGASDFYDRTIELNDYSAINSWFNYFYSPVGERINSEVAFLDIPAVGGASYEITISNGTEMAACGEATFGGQTIIGDSGFGAAVGIINYSRKDTDQFGNIVITKRGSASRGSFDILVDTVRVAFVKRQLTNVKDVPVVFIGDENRSETIFFGFYRDFNLVIEGPVKSRCALEIEGLV